MSLPTDRSATRELHNLFFAVVPGDAERAAIAAAAQRLRELAPRGRWIKPHRYHLTVQFLGEFAQSPQAAIERALAAATRVRAEAFDLVLDQAGSFRNRDIPWWLGSSASVSGLATLRASLAMELIRASFSLRDGKPLTPHVTVLRNADRTMDATPVQAIRWRVDEFVLIDSRVAPDPDHIVMGKWPLVASA